MFNDHNYLYDKNINGESEENLIKCMNNVKNKKANFGSSENLSAIKYLLTYKQDRISEEEAVFLIKSLVEIEIQKMKKNQNDLSVDVKILSNSSSNYEIKADAVCKVKGKNKYCLEYSPNVVSYIKSQLISDKLLGLSIIFHELAHVKQFISLGKEYIDRYEAKGTTEEYIMGLENMAYSVSRDFYIKNMKSFMIERQALKAGYEGAFDAIMTYAPEEYKRYRNEYENSSRTSSINSERKISRNKESMKNELNEDSIYVDDKKFNVKDRIKILEFLAYKYVKNNPKAIMQYPVLKLSFNSDGSRKNINQLLADRIKMINTRYADRNEIDKLYSTIIEERFTYDYDYIIAQMEKNKKNGDVFFDNIINDMKQRKDFLENGNDEISIKKIGSTIRKKNVMGYFKELLGRSIHKETR